MLCKSFAICKAKNTKIITAGFTKLFQESKGGLKLDLGEEGVLRAHSCSLASIFV